MVQNTTKTYFFLGANSRYGFYSLYDQFAFGSGDHLTIIKSGPGTGKSTFMRRIGAAAEANGYDVEYILCSGDPHSLDGIYIPALQRAWVDGTAPHILEPHHFGIDGTYEDLGRFCQTELLTTQSCAIRNTTELYRTCYRKAYTYLEAAAKLYDTTSTLPTDVEQRIRKRAQAKIKRELSHCPKTNLSPTKRFISGISCLGNYTLFSTLNTLCNRLCALSPAHGLEQIFFQEIVNEANTQKHSYILCPSPLSPNLIEAIIFPSLNLCFGTFSDVSEFHGTVRTIHLDAYEPIKIKSESKQKEKLHQQLMDAAFLQLNHAKQYHDELESYYRPALNIEALTEYTNNVISGLFHK